MYFIISATEISLVQIWTKKVMSATDARSSHSKEGLAWLHYIQKRPEHCGAM